MIFNDEIFLLQQIDASLNNQRKKYPILSSTISIITTNYSFIKKQMFNHHFENIQDGRELSAIFLTVFGDGWKDLYYIYIIWCLNLIVFSEKGVSCSVLFTSYCLYIGWKGNMCHPFNSRRGRLKGPTYIYIYIYIYTHTQYGV